jgi:uncharacterized protein (TIGR04141 family)
VPAPRRALTIYHLRRQPDGAELTDFDQAIDPDWVPQLETHDLGNEFDFDARLYVWAPQSAQPAWAEFLRGGFGNDVTVTETANNRALVVLRFRYYNADRYFALPFGAGRFLLRSNAYERSYGLRAALNVIYEGDSPDAPTALARVRRVDAKTVAQNTLRTLRQANRYATFEEFGIDIQRDLLGAVTGQPADAATWGSRIAGHDAIYLNISTEFADLGEICRRVWRAARQDDYRARFEWIDQIRVVDDPDLVGQLTGAVLAQLRLGETGQLDLTPPELVEWDDIESFTFDLNPEDPHPDLTLAEYLALVDTLSAVETLTVEQIKRHRASAHDNSGEVIYQWPVFRCLTGEITLDSATYLLEEGDFFEIDPDYLATLDTYVGALNESAVLLPDSARIGGQEQTEGDYNQAAAQFSPDHLLLDKKTVKVTSHTDPIEICDVLTTDRRFIHVKRKLQSSSLSHLFAQGYVSADLFLMSAEYREVTRQKILEAEQERATAAEDPTFHGRFSGLFNFDAANPATLEVVYGIIAPWSGGGRSLVEALPFFSKVNLRRHTDDLRRMGYRVTYKRINVV